MKKVFVLLAVVLFVFGAAAFADNGSSDDWGGEETIYENCISTNVWPWAVGLYNIGYERMLGSSISIRPRATYWGLIDLGGASLFALGGDVFFHPMGKGVKGWFMGPRYDVWIATGEGATGMMHFIGAQAVHKFIFEGGFALGISLGAQINIANTLSYEGESESLGVLGGTMPCFDLELAWAF